MVNNIDVLLRLINGRRFASGMAGAAASVQGFKSSVEGAATASSGLRSAAFGAEGALYAVGAASRAATVAAGATMAAFTGLGIQFAATMESNVLAFDHFAGGAEQAKVLTQDLFTIAEETPFAFTDITMAARKFLAFGYTVQETKDLLETLGDTLALTGGGTLEIQRLTKAFGDIRAKGRLMQQELNQLTSVGINPYEMLEKGGLKLTKEQMKNVGRAFIPAEKAILALKSGLDQTFGGGRQAYLKTFSGQWQRLKDNISQAAGNAVVSSGIFNGLVKAIKSLNKWIDNNGDTINRVYKGAVKIIGGVLVGAFKLAKGIFEQLYDAFEPAAPFFENVLIPLIKGFAVGLGVTLVGAFRIVTTVIKFFATILGRLGEILKPFKPVFFAIGAALSMLVGWVVRAISWLGKFGGVFRVVAGAIRFLMTPLRALWKFFGPLRTAMATAITGMIDIAHRFGDVLGGVFKTIKKGLEWIIDKINWVLDKAKPLQDIVGFAVPGGDTGLFSDNGILGVGGVPFIASGGTITEGGMAVVGERGPELVKLPTGSQVINHMNTARVKRNNPKPGFGGDRTSGPAFDSVNVTVVSPIHIDRRKIGEAVGTYVAERKARR